MKRIFTLFISLCSLAVMGQYPVSSINITMPAKPAANMADWATGGTPLIITAQAKLVQGQVPGNLMESRILVTIKSGDRKICGSFTQQTAPYSTFNAATKTWSGAAALRLLGGNCILKPGSYELCVQFFSSYAPITPFSNEVCKSFTIADNKQLTYSPPQLVMPANGKNFTQQEIKQPIQLRWTPVVPPPPNNDVIYTVRIYEVKQGQQPAQAVKTTAPVFEKEVRTTQTIWQMPGKYASSKENKTFVWSIQAHNAEDRTLIEGGGRVELFSFGLKSVMTPWMSVYVNDQLGNQTLDSCHFTFSFNHPGGAGNFHLKLLDATLNNLTCEDNTSLQICAITPVMEFATTNASLNIDYDNNTGIAIIDHDENNQITGLSRLICGHNYLVIVCSDEGGDLGGGIYHSCASFLFNCCTPPPAKCACKGWDPIIVTVNGVKHTVACGGTIHVPLNTTYSISTDLLCTGKNCVKQLDGKIIYPNGTTVPYNFGSGAALIGPMSSTIPQNLQMCFNGTCNNYTSCLPCCINIIVDSSAIPNCKCKGWKTNTGTYNDIATVFTHDFKCGGGTYTLNAGMIYNFNSPVYLCDLAGCNPTYKWKVDGVLQGTGTSFSYTAVAGSHLITIQPYCGIDSCSPCEFKVIIPDSPHCKCKGWKTTSGTYSNTATHVKYDFKCDGGPYNLVQGNTYVFNSPVYQCTPVNCNPTYKWKVDGVLQGTGTSFSYTAVAGSHLITIQPYCGTDSCSPCEFKVIIPDSLHCKCKGWKTNTGTYNDIATVFTHDFKCGGGPYTLNAGVIYNFNSPVYLCDLAGCNPTYKWKVDGVLQGTGTSFSYTAVAGSHLITIQPYCGIDSCSPCEFKVVVKDEKSSCNCSFKPVFEYIARSGKTGNYYSQL